MVYINSSHEFNYRWFEVSKKAVKTIESLIPAITTNIAFAVANRAIGESLAETWIKLNPTRKRAYKRWLTIKRKQIAKGD